MMQEMRTDRDLIDSARREPGGFTVLYDRHAETVLATLRSRCGDGDTALELTGETFARALAGLGRARCDEHGSAIPWLLAIARNVVREWRREGVVSATARHRLGMPVHADELDSATERASAAQLGSRLRGALARLPVEQRAAVALRVVGEQSYDEIAAALDCTPAAARQRVARGLRGLRTRIGSEVA
jgi:RNA polymerase sigma-70 factor (ECF subfamily)